MTHSLMLVITRILPLVVGSVDVSMQFPTAIANHLIAPDTASLTFRTVSAGSAHFCGLDSEGSVQCWGDNQWGQLGNGSTESSPMNPLRVPTFQKFKQVSAGATTTCALTESGYAYCWGTDFSGVMGDASLRERCNGVPCSTLPVPTAIGMRFDSISVGFEHACGIYDKRLYCWGRGDAGQIGATPRSMCDGVACSRTPVSVGAGASFTSVSARGTRTCGISNSQVRCWGPIDDFESATVANAVQVSGAGAYSCAVLVDGSVDCWGANDRGRLGAADGAARSAHIVATDGTRFVEVSTGGTHTCGLTSAGAAYCWGSNVDGRLGGLAAATCAGQSCTATPVRVAIEKPLTHIAAGGSSSCATAVDGEVYCWGNLGRTVTQASAGRR